jgi:hypothetical protein
MTVSAPPYLVGKNKGRIGLAGSDDAGDFEGVRTSSEDGRDAKCGDDQEKAQNMGLR